MKRLLNRVSLLGLVLLITPLLVIASDGHAEKSVAAQAMLTSLCGLALAAAGTWCHCLLRRLERMKEERTSFQPKVVCYDVSPGSSRLTLPPSSF